MPNENVTKNQASPPKKNPSAKWLPIAIIAAIVVVGLFMRSRGAKKEEGGGAAGEKTAQNAAPEVAAVKTVAVKTGDITETLPITGTLKSNQNVALSSKISGRVARVYVRDGSPVRIGQLLIALDDGDLRAQVAAARAQLKTAQVRYDQTVIGVPARVQQVNTAIVQAEAALGTAQARYRQALLNEPAQVQTARGQVATARDTVRTAQARLKQARDTAALTEKQVNADIRRAESVVTSSTSAVAAARANAAQQQAALAEVRRGARAQQIAQAQAAVNVAQANLRNAETELNRTKILVAGGAAAQSSADQAQTAYDVAKANLESQQQNLSLIREGSTTEEVRQAEERARSAQESINQALSGVTQAEAGLTTAQAGRSRIQVAQGDVTNALAALSQAQTGFQTATANLSQIPITRQETRVAAQAVDEARAALLQARANRSQIPVATSDVKAAAAAVQTAEAALRQAEVNLNYARIYSPVNGVVNQKLTDPGQTAAPGSALMNLVALDNIYFEAQVSENNVRDLRIGQPTQVSVPAVSTASFTGYVADIIPTADPKTRQFRIRITIPAPPRQLTPGAFARGVLTTRQVRNTLVLPTEVIRDDNNQSVVLTAVGTDQNSVVKRNVVKTGAVSGGMTQIVGGLQLNDKAILSTQTLEDGEKVRVDNKN